MSGVTGRVRATLDGRYRIERELGAGGMATVYLAEDLRHHRQVAVKVLREELAASLGPERFQREIEIAARLHHPHILPLYDSGEADGFLFYVMPYVEGESLRARLSREGELPVADAVRLLREVADALAKAHAQGVVHRDIKPDNVMLADRHALVTDFGVAKAVSEAAGATGITTAGVALGTPAYMAPEQAAADPGTDHRADIYAFGVLAYEMLTGQPPFTGHTAQQVLAAHLTEAPAPVTQRRQTVPAPLAELVMRCLEKKPADRWQSAAEMVGRLEVIATPSGGMPPTTAVSAVKAPARTRWLLGAGGLVAAALAVWAFAFRGPAGPGLDPNLVVVLPFRVASAAPELSYLREGVVDMLATMLTGEGGTARAVEPATSIAGWRKRVASDADDLDQKATESLAREVGAGSVLSGSVIGNEQRLTIRASLAGVGGLFTSDPLQVSVEGPADSLSALLAQVAGRLLARSAGVRAEESANLLTSSLPALRAYLRGQSLYRGGEYVEAIRQYWEALQADSNFALAGAGLVAANGWIGFATGEMNGVAQRAAWRNRDRLGPKDRALMIARLGPNGPGPDWLADQLAAARAASDVAADRAEAWYMLGDQYLHGGLLTGVENALDLAEDGLRRALARDSTDAGVLQHLILLAARRHDTAEVRRIAELRRQAVSDPFVQVPERYLAAAFLGDETERQAVLALIDTAPLPPEFINDAAAVSYGVSMIPGNLSAVREYMAHLARRATAPSDREWTTALQGYLALDAGRPALADTLFGAGPVADGARVMAGLFWGGDTVAAAQAVGRLRAAPDQVSIHGFLGEAPACLVGLWDLSRGSTVGLDGRIRTLRGSDSGRDPAWPPTRNQLCALVLEAGQAEASGNPRASALVDSLNGVLVRGPGLGVLNWQNLAVAGMLERQGDHTRAAAAARRTRQYWVYIPYLSSYYREAGRLAELAGDREGAIGGYGRYLDLRKDPEPSVQPEVDRVKQALARLTAERP